MNVLIPIANGYTDSEFIYAYHRMKEEGHEVFVATPDGKGVVGDKGWVVKDEQVDHTMDKDLLDARFEVFCLIGGVKCIEKLRLNKFLIQSIEEHFLRNSIKQSQNVVIASICHGAQLLIEADIPRMVSGKVSGYYSIAKDIVNAGAAYSKNCNVAMYTRPDGSQCAVVTAAHYNDNHTWMKLTIDAIGVLLEGKSPGRIETLQDATDNKNQRMNLATKAEWL
jgi:protease I